MIAKDRKGLKVSIAEMDAAIPKAEYTVKSSLTLIHKGKPKWQVKYIDECPLDVVSPKACDLELIKSALRSLPVFDSLVERVLAYRKEGWGIHTFYVKLMSGNLVEIYGAKDGIEFKTISL